MTWDKFLDTPVESPFFKQVQTDILCPKCGKRNIYLDSTIILTTYPAKYSYWCPCGWTGSAPTRWVGER